MTVIGLAAALFAGPARSSEADTDWTAYLRRVGPVRVGMSAGQVREALRDRAPARGQSAIAGGCNYLGSAALPKGLAVMLEGRTVVRVDITTAGIRTASGVGVGDTEDTIQATYPGRIRVTPHKYEKQGHYLHYVSRDPHDRDVGMVFETDGTRVTTFRIGTVDAIALVERCG